MKIASHDLHAQFEDFIPVHNTCTLFHKITFSFMQNFLFEENTIVPSIEWRGVGALRGVTRTSTLISINTQLLYQETLLYIGHQISGANSHLSHPCIQRKIFEW